jgi:hypothetical protein
MQYEMVFRKGNIQASVVNPGSRNGWELCCELINLGYVAVCGRISR